MFLENLLLVGLKDVGLKDPTQFGSAFGAAFWSSTKQTKDTSTGTCFDFAQEYRKNFGQSARSSAKSWGSPGRLFMGQPLEIPDATASARASVAFFADDTPSAPFPAQTKVLRHARRVLPRLRGRLPLTSAPCSTPDSQTSSLASSTTAAAFGLAIAAASTQHGAYEGRWCQD
jgi:hypothetical protein